MTEINPMVFSLVEGGELPYMDYMGMCGPKRVVFQYGFGQKWGIDFS